MADAVLAAAGFLLDRKLVTSFTERIVCLCDTIQQVLVEMGGATGSNGDGNPVKVTVDELVMDEQRITRVREKFMFCSLQQRILFFSEFQPTIQKMHQEGTCE